MVKDKVIKFLNKYEIIIGILGISIFTIACLYFATEVMEIKVSDESLIYIFNGKEHVANGTTKDGWLSYYGSYWGGIFSGVISLIVLLITVTQTRRFQQENQKLTQKIQSDNEHANKYREKIEFVNNLAEHIAVYITHINGNFQKQYLKYWSKDHGELDKANAYGGVLYGEEKSNELKHRLASDENIINKLNNNEYNLDRTKANEMYFLIKMKLNGISVADELVKELTDIHNIHSYIENPYERYKEKEIFEKHMDKLQILAQKFITEYPEN